MAAKAITDPDKLLSTRYVAEQFGVTVETVGKWFKSGELKGVRINGFWRVRYEDYQTFVHKKLGIEQGS